MKASSSCTVADHDCRHAVAPAGALEPTVEAGGLTAGRAAPAARAPAASCRTGPSRTAGRTALALALLVGAAATAAGQPAVSAVRVEEPPNVDGQLTDDVWRRAAHLSDFVQTAPVEGAAPSESTDVYLAYDGENLYVGIRARYGDTGVMRANRADRDQIAEDDTVSLFFDPFRDRQRAYQFTVNGFGVQGTPF